MTSKISLLGINGSPRKSGGTVVMMNEFLGGGPPARSKNKDTEWMWKDTALLVKNLVTLCEAIKKEKPEWDY